MLINKCHPGRHNNCKTCTVSTIIKTAKFMFNSVAVPVLIAANTNNIVMCNHSGPHDICTGFVIIRVSNYFWSFVNHCLENTFAKAVSCFYVLCICKIALADMSHNISRTTGSLVSRKSLCQSRIQNRKLWTQHIVSKAALNHSFFFSDYSVRRAF